MTGDNAVLTLTDDGLTLPLVEVVTGRGFITGKSGSGKSNSASVVAEELLDAGAPLLIVDTDGEYYGLKEQYELLHVGGDAYCDVEVTPAHAKTIAELAVVERVPVILDVSGYPDRATSHELVEGVVKHLFEIEKAQQTPFLLLVEEAHEFIPEGAGLDDLGEMLIRVAKRGRKRGLGICAMSQRPAAVDKDYITQCDWIVWHRLTWENDTKVAGRILGSDWADTVQDLETGECILLTDWDEQIRREQIRRKRTYDAGATPGFGDQGIAQTRPIDETVLDQFGEGNVGGFSRPTEEPPMPMGEAESPEVETDRARPDTESTDDEDGAADTDGTDDGPVDADRADDGPVDAGEADENAADAAGDGAAGDDDSAAGDDDVPAAPETPAAAQMPTPSATPTPMRTPQRLQRRPPPNQASDDVLWEIGLLVVHLMRAVTVGVRQAFARVGGVIDGLAREVERAVTPAVDRNGAKLAGDVAPPWYARVLVVVTLVVVALLAVFVVGLLVL